MSELPNVPLFTRIKSSNSNGPELRIRAFFLLQNNLDWSHNDHYKKLFQKTIYDC